MRTCRSGFSPTPGLPRTPRYRAEARPTQDPPHNLCDLWDLCGKAFDVRLPERPSARIFPSHFSRWAGLPSTMPIRLSRIGLMPQNFKMLRSRLLRLWARKYQRYTNAGMPMGVPPLARCRHNAIGRRPATQIKTAPVCERTRNNKKAHGIDGGAVGTIPLDGLVILRHI